MTSGPTRYLALLRGVNVGKRQIAMTELRRVLVELGLEEVATYLQSGNVMFTTASSDRTALKEAIEPALAAKFGFEVLTILRTANEMRAAIESCPYRQAAEDDPTKVHLTFVEPMPAPGVWEGVDLDRHAPESMTPGERVLYMHLPGGIGRAKLPDTMNRAIRGVVATTRNWRTSVNLTEMLEEEQ